MPAEEISLMPINYIKKFGSFTIKVEEQQAQAHLEENKTLSFYDQTRGLKKLMTNAEKEAVEAEKDMYRKKIGHKDYEREGYMKRQPRLDLSKYNYNFEQFREYTALYERAKKRDTEELTQFYKMVKYVQVNLPKGDKRALALSQRFRMDLIDVPEEFKDVSIEDMSGVKKDKRSRRPIVRNRTNRDLSDYDCWRVHDRFLIKGGGKQACTTKIVLPPALLVRAFGLPSHSRTGFDGTGEYDFEDANLDIFNVCDYKKTDFYHGFNREDEYYEKELRKPPHKRRRKYPSIREFWESMEPVEFKIYSGDQADWRKFKVWLKKTVMESVNRKIPFDQEIQERFGHEVDICVGDNYDLKGKVNTEMAIFKWDNTYFMTPDELKKLKDKPEPLIPPKSFDFSKAERVIITKEDIKRREMELEQEKLKGL